MEQKEINYDCPKCKSFGAPDTDDCKHFICSKCGFGYCPTQPDEKEIYRIKREIYGIK